MSICQFAYVISRCHFKRHFYVNGALENSTAVAVTSEELNAEGCCKNEEAFQRYVARQYSIFVKQHSIMINKYVAYVGQLGRRVRRSLGLSLNRLAMASSMMPDYIWIHRDNGELLNCAIDRKTMSNLVTWWLTSDKVLSGQALELKHDYKILNMLKRN